jgi:hypothetical protein
MRGAILVTATKQTFTIRRQNVITKEERRLKLDFIEGRIREELEKWAEAEQILLPGQSIFFGLDVVWKSPKKEKVKRTSKYQMKRIMEFKPEDFTNEEWENLKSIPQWYREQKAVITCLQRRKNEPVNKSRLFKNKRNWSSWNSFIGTFNYRLESARLNYKLISNPYKPGYYALVRTT